MVFAHIFLFELKYLHTRWYSVDCRMKVEFVSSNTIYV